MATIKFVSRGERSNSVMLRVTVNRKSSELAMGFSMDEDLLNEILSGAYYREYEECRSRLIFYQRVAEDLKTQFTNEGRIDHISAAEFRNAIKAEAAARMGLQVKQKSGGFIEFYEKRMNAKANAGYKTSIEYTLNKILAFCEDKKNGCYKDACYLSFEDITLRWLNDFDEWLVAQGAAQNSRNIHFKNIRTVMNRAIDEELTNNYPFRRFKIKPEATRKRSLSLKDLRKLFSYPCEEYQQYYIDMFKLIFMLIGINAVDLSGLKRIENGRIEYSRAKTHRLYSIKVEPEAMEIIRKYKGEKNLLNICDRWKNYQDFTKNANIALKKIGKMRIVGRGGKKEITPEWPELSLYWARHTWATIAYNECGISKDVISQALGHSTGVSVTEIYLDKDQKLVDEANRKVLDFVLYGK